MKHSGYAKLQEGRLLAAVLAVLALFVLLVGLNRLLRSIAVEPVRSVSGEELIVLLDLNTATADELARLPGIGAELADRIIAWREENGAFSSVNDLDAVPGIGAGKIAAIENLVFCG